MAGNGRVTGSTAGDIHKPSQNCQIVLKKMQSKLMKPMEHDLKLLYGKKRKKIWLSGLVMIKHEFRWF